MQLIFLHHWSFHQLKWHLNPYKMMYMVPCQALSTDTLNKPNATLLAKFMAEIS